MEDKVYLDPITQVLFRNSAPPWAVHLRDVRVSEWMKYLLGELTWNAETNTVKWTSPCVEYEPEVARGDDYADAVRALVGDLVARGRNGAFTSIDTRPMYLLGFTLTSATGNGGFNIEPLFSDYVPRNTRGVRWMPNGPVPCSQMGKILLQAHRFQCNSTNDETNRIFSINGESHSPMGMRTRIEEILKNAATPVKFTNLEWNQGNAEQVLGRTERSPVALNHPIHTMAPIPHFGSRRRVVPDNGIRLNRQNPGRPAPSTEPFRPEEFRVTPVLGSLGMANDDHPAFRRPLPPTKVEAPTRMATVVVAWSVDNTPQARDRQARFRRAMAQVHPTHGDLDLKSLPDALARPLAELRLAMTVDPFRVVFRDVMDPTKHPGYAMSLVLSIAPLPGHTESGIAGYLREILRETILGIAEGRL